MICLLGKGKPTQAVNTSSIFFKDRAGLPQPQGPVFGTPRRLDEAQCSTRLCIFTPESPMHPSVHYPGRGREMWPVPAYIATQLSKS
eukprot:1136616-Pelagomonas_calceolata.AAC.1